MKKREKVKKRKNRNKINILYGIFLYIKFKIFLKLIMFISLIFYKFKYFVIINT